MSEIIPGLPGYREIELPEEPEIAGTEGWSTSQWQADFETTREALKCFFATRDPFIVLARTASQFNIGDGDINISHGIRQVDVELTQIFLLLNGESVSRNPTSPRMFARYWSLLKRHLHGFIRKIPDNCNQTDTERFVSSRVRLQTMHYRNLFSREGCEEVIDKILSRVDRQSDESIGFKLSELFRATVYVGEFVQGRLQIFADKIRRLFKSNARAEVINCIDFFRSAYPVADKAWRNRTDRFASLEALRMAGFQLSELAHPWIYTITRADLERKFSKRIVELLYSLALAPGDINDVNPEHIYLNNPIWKRPYVLREDGSLFVAIPQIVYSFPFVIVESLIDGHRKLELPYENARAAYLEEAIQALVSTAMPSATVYRGVAWDDPDTGQVWESDVIALVGNFIFVFEAKSGRINDATKRGGILSLRRNFVELFVQPGEQSGRLERYLNTKGKSSRLRIKDTGKEINVGLEYAKVVFTFSICIEHFTVLTSARHYLKELGLISDQTPWSPVISLGELQMIVRYLDSEVSFIHYLTRRATLEQVLDFEGDEQDILSAYLINGLWVANELMGSGRVIFFASDNPVRLPKIARADRSVVQLHGIALSPMWESIVRELYRDKSLRHRFDIINVILNQMPPALADLERRIRRFRRGVSPPDGDMAFLKFVVGRKVFVLTIYLAKKLPDQLEWQVMGRNVTKMLLDEGGAVECAAFVFTRRSRSATYDGVSFYRYVSRSSSDHESEDIRG